MTKKQLKAEFDALKKQWETAFFKLVGRTIAGVRYMSPAEMSALGWDSAPIVITLDDGTIFYSSKDDEGNDGGALFVQEGVKTKGISEVAPAIRDYS